ncbi:MAG: cysteine--tRNA ligase [Nitrososphaerales archaeon]
MPLRVYNTYSRRLEVFTPTSEGVVKMFVCGPTVYDYLHLGHARTYIFYDVVARYFKQLGYEVIFIINITDIDDKIFEKAKKEGKSGREVAAKYSGACIEDLKRLGVDTVTLFAQASNYLPQMIQQIQTLLEKEYAYKTSRGIFFDTSRFPTFGALSHQSRTELALRKIDLDPEKKNPADFLLWRKVAESDEGYDSPFGRGRPGWHIEDTAISITHFGSSYDVHGGAVELIYPHHEAEIAQAEAYTGHTPFVKYWIHTALLKIGGEKMAKSAGNYITIRDALEKYSPNLLRLYFLSTKYRRNILFDQDELLKLRSRLKSIEKFWYRCSMFASKYEGGELSSKIKILTRRFTNHMNQDFNTPAAIKAIFDTANYINTTTAVEAKNLLKNSYKTIANILSTLGLVVNHSWRL